MKFCITDFDKQSKEMEKFFHEYGYLHITNIFTKDEIKDAEKGMLNLYMMQIGKIGDYKADVDIIASSDKSDVEKISAIIELAEKKDKEALYNVQKFIVDNLKIKKLYANSNFEKISKLLLKAQNKEIMVNGPGLFINMPKTDRLLYKWHSESHYYPKRLNFLNVWLPIFRDKGEHDGTMSIKVKSHLHADFPFSEYRGFNKDTENKENYFTQYEIPENFVAEFESKTTISKVGDVVIFHRKLVHRSNNNKSDQHSYALVSRVWEPSYDLSLSGDLASLPYKNQDGRANLVVEQIF
jgi:ectoine hydroxylase-related dioxygenase (phytanoyl-CoA dioxygenase family)